MATEVTVESAAAAFHIQPPEDPATAEYLVKVVNKAIAKGTFQKMLDNWKLEREAFRIFIDPDVVYTDGDYPNDVVE